jgi:hypothetical protein
MRVVSRELLYTYQPFGLNAEASTVGLALANQPTKLSIVFDKTAGVNGQSCSYTYTKDTQAISATSEVPPAPSPTDAYTPSTTDSSYPTQTPMYSGAESFGLSVAAIFGIVLAL